MGSPPRRPRGRRPPRRERPRRQHRRRADVDCKRAVRRRAGVGEAVDDRLGAVLDALERGRGLLDLGRLEAELAGDAFLDPVIRPLGVRLDVLEVELVETPVMGEWRSERARK